MVELVDDDGKVLLSKSWIPMGVLGPGTHDGVKLLISIWKSHPGAVVAATVVEAEKKTELPRRRYTIKLAEPAEVGASEYSGEALFCLAVEGLVIVKEGLEFRVAVELLGCGCELISILHSPPRFG